MGLVPDQPRVFPVGRLDADSEGLLILTNDGDLAQRLSHPSFGVEKEYLAEVEGVPSAGALRQLRQGVELEDGMTAPATVGVVGPRGAADRDPRRAQPADPTDDRRGGPSRAPAGPHPDRAAGRTGPRAGGVAAAHPGRGPGPWPQSAGPRPRPGVRPGRRPKSGEAAVGSIGVLMALSVRALRGATTADPDSPEQIADRVQELLRELFDRNGVDHDDLISIVFTATGDLVSVLPGRRRPGPWGSATCPLLCARELDIVGSTPRCLRVLVHLTTEKARGDLHHVYLHGARGLRDDLPE